MEKKKRWTIGMLAGVLAALTTVGGVAAYFTDTDTQVNSFTIGKIKIDLQEPEWDEKEDSDGDGIPDEAEDMQPAQTISKDPQVQNTGINEAYIFMTVETPYQNLVTVNADGTKNEAKDTALYVYETNTNWMLLGTTYEMDAQEQYVSEKKLYAYADETGNCIPLQPDAVTNTLFDSVTMENVAEGQELEGQEFQIAVAAYGIQTTNLKNNSGENTTKADTVWNIISNQNALTDVYTK